MPLVARWLPVLLLVVPGALFGYWLLPKREQNVFLLLASLALSAAIDVRFALLLFGSTVVDHAIGSRLAWDRPEKSRTRWLWASVVLNVGLLAAFRSAAFFLGGPKHGPMADGGPVDDATLQLVVPLGLSFYTLQRLTYSFDVYYRVLQSSTSFSTYATFVTFFPLLTAGPIERARNLLPQLEKKRVFDWDRFYGACWLIGFGAFQKLFIADHVGELVGSLLLGEHPGRWPTLIAIYGYAAQIYADFAGYSDMARGVARLFGIEVMKNFEAPYLSANISEYWQRWHISLSSWLFDYVFKPCTMWLRRLGNGALVAAAFATFLLSGLWHGTGLTFLVWGLLHATAYALFLLSKKWRKKLKAFGRSRIGRALSVVVTFHFVCLGYVIFRSSSLADAWKTLVELTHGGAIDAAARPAMVAVLAFLATTVGLQALESKHPHAPWIFRCPVWVRAACYAALLFCVLRFPGPTGRFIYAEF